MSQAPQIQKNRWRTIRKVISTLKETPLIIHACKEANINRRTFYRWMERDKKLRERVEVAINSTQERQEPEDIRNIEAALYLSAVGGFKTAVRKKYRQGVLVEEFETFAPPNPASMFFYLSNRASHKWKNNRDRFMPPSEHEAALRESEVEILTADQRKESNEMLKEFQE